MSILERDPLSRLGELPGLVSHLTNLDVPANIRHAHDEDVSCIEQTYIPNNCDDRFDGFHFAPFLKRNSGPRTVAKLGCGVA